MTRAAVLVPCAAVLSLAMGCGSEDNAPSPGVASGTGGALPDAAAPIDTGAAGAPVDTGAAGARLDSGGTVDAPASDAGGYPDRATTGPDLTACPGGALTKYTGGSTLYRATTGEVISCTEFDDVPIYVAQDISDVTIKNCLFVITQDTFINVQGANVTIENTGFRGPAGTWIRNSYNGNHLTVRRCDFSGMANAVEFNVGSETLEDNYAHDFGTVSADQHADGLQTDGTSHAVIRHNNVLLNDVAGATGAISIMGDAGDDILVENNRVAGGGYTVYPGGASYTNIRFLNNCFSTVFYPGKAQTGLYGPWYPSQNPPTLVRTGNTWCDGPKAGQALDN